MTPYDPTLYLGAAAHYTPGRPPYSRELAATLATEAGLDGSGRLLDFGCGPGSLTVDRNGRLLGVLDVTLRQAPRALGAMGTEGVIAPEAAQAASAVAEARQGAGDTAQATLNFQAGRTTLGPVALGPAPKIYDPR